jgi:hypothetical protein
MDREQASLQRIRQVRALRDPWGPLVEINGSREVARGVIEGLLWQGGVCP